MGRTAGTQAFHDASGHIRHVSVGITLQKRCELLLELLGIIFRQIRERIDKYEFRKYLRQRIITLHLRRQRMHGGIIVGEIRVVRALIHVFLDLVHATQIVKIRGILHSLAIRRIREFRQYQLTPSFRLRLLAAAHRHQIHVIVYVKAIDIVRIAFKQSVELTSCRGVVLKFVFQNDTHIV